MTREERIEHAKHGAAQRKLRYAAIGGVALLAVVALLLLLPLAPKPAGPAPLVAHPDDPVQGGAGAPVQLFYFADFQCPYCQHFELAGGLDGIRADYVNASKVLLVFKNFPILGDDSWTAGQASDYVWVHAPGTYWDWHRQLYQAQKGENSGWASADNLVAFSSQFPAINATDLRAALQERAHLDAVTRDAKEGRAWGVRGTPTVVIAGKAVNALDDQAVRSALDAALAAKGAP